MSSKNLCRVGDTGVGWCRCHFRRVTVFFTVGSHDTKTNNRDTMTVGGMGVATCRHSTIATSGSPTVLINNKPVHRIGDAGNILCSGNYVAVTGSENVLAG